MQLPPASVLAGWPKPNYVDPPVHNNSIIIMNLAFYPIVVIVIGLRIYTRCTISKSFGADDYLIITALLPTTGYTAIALLAEVHFHLDRHVWDVRPENIISGLKLILVSQIVFTLAQTLTKLSMLSLIYRIMSNTSVTLKNVTKFIMVFITMGALTFILVVVLQCRPLPKYWTFSVEPQGCINEPIHVLVASILNTLNDVIVVVFPIPTVWSLQLPRRQQVIVLLLFAGGFIVCIAGGVRTYFTYKMLSSYDKTWDSYGNWISSSIELYVGVICASIPATKPFFQTFLPSLLGSALSSRKSRYIFSTKDKSSSRNSAFADLELQSNQGPFKRLDTKSEDSTLPRKMLDAIVEAENNVSDSSLSSFIGETSTTPRSFSIRSERNAYTSEIQRANSARAHDDGSNSQYGASRR